MNLRFWMLSVGLLAAASARAQSPVTITAADMFNRTNLYYLAYSNADDPKDPSSTFPCSHLMGTTGGPQLWDFTTGPTELVLRYDYLPTNGLPGIDNFPQAKIAEQKTVMGSNQTNWLFFEQVANVGRKLYGYYDDSVSSDKPATVFDPPMVDFPDPISYNDTWNTSYTTISTFDLLGSSFPVKTTYSSIFTVDAYGTIELPQLSFGPALRVNEAQTIDISADQDGTGDFQMLATYYTRNYYWLSPGHGIAAQLNSVQSDSPPPNDFNQAVGFVRMFETNLKPAPASTNSTAVTDLKIAVNNGQVLLKWTAPSGVHQYRVDYAADSLTPGSWKTLATLTNQVFQLDSATLNRARFYRIVSLP